MIRRSSLALVIAGCAALPTSAQPARPDTGTVALPTVEVSAARGAASVATAPFSVAVVDRTAAERLAEPGASLAPVLERLPGLFVADRENAALGERLSVRGLGYRAPFGVRGVQVVLDGVPLTLADGQAVLGIADPALVRQAELVRGPAAALWGNASGGVLVLHTIPADGAPTARARVLGGGYGTQRVEAEAAGPLGRHRAGAAVSHVRQDGYRAYSGVDLTRARLFSDVALSPATSIRLVGAVESMPFAENPSALTAEQLAADPRQARPSSVERRAGKESLQGQVAATLRTESALGRTTATVYGIARQLDNPLPFDRYVDLERLAGGTRLGVERPLGPLRLTLSADAAVQHDDRQYHGNEAGRRGALSLDQTETVLQAGLAARLRLDLAPVGLPGAALSGALRGDRVRFSADDRLLIDGDASGDRTLGAWSPQLGATYRVGPALLYASYATAFETPTTTELVNSPTDVGGFNPVLEPQRTRGVEAGVRGVAGRLLYDVAVYALRVEDGISGAEAPDGRSFFVNRGETEHRGLEAFAEWRPVPVLRFSGAYTWARLRFGADNPDGDGGSLEGNELPGVPEHRVAGRVWAERWALFVAAEIEAASGVYADDANAVRTDGYATLDLAVGALALRRGGVTLRPFVQLRNAFGRSYVGSVSINAFGGRYFEPAAERTLWAGVEVAL